jgi:hypothetical protein
LEEYMARSVPWLPRREQDLVDLCKIWLAGLGNAAIVTAFGWLQAYVTAVSDAIDAFFLARDLYLADKTVKNRMAKDEAKDAAIAAMQDFANTSIRYNKKMTPEQKLDYGVVTRGPGHRIEVPSTVPELNPRPGNVREIILDYQDVGADSNGKPEDVHGIEIRWAILDHVPSGVEELIHSSFATRHPFRISFREGDRGKTVYFAARWEIQRGGEKGKFGPIVSAVIP